jgi:hypothetical protein
MFVLKLKKPFKVLCDLVFWNFTKILEIVPK